LHLAVVFGLDTKTAIRYASSAHQLLETEIECDTVGCDEPKGPGP
jgi:hypothetical protein